MDLGSNGKKKKDDQRKQCQNLKNIKDRPEGSTSLAIFIASEVAISWFAGEMANIMQLGCTIKNSIR